MCKESCEDRAVEFSEGRDYSDCESEEIWVD
jgi:hypothetical protein